jgi:hypothetical protein
MITYIKTKKKVPVNTCPKMLGFPYIHPYMFFICAVLDLTNYLMYKLHLVRERLSTRPI